MSYEQTYENSFRIKYEFPKYYDDEELLVEF